MRAARGIVLNVLAVAICACSAAQQEAPVTASRTAARVALVERGIVRRSSSGVDSGPPTTLVTRMAELRIPGLGIAVFDSGRIQWARSYGVRDVATGIPVDSLTLFQAASISKPVAAAAVFRLAEMGRIRLDDDVNTMLRSWQLPASAFTDSVKVTPRRILSHTAGLGVHGFGGYVPGEPLPSLAEILDGAPPANSPAVRVVQPPGVGEIYSGGGVTIMQLLMEDVTGTSFAELMEGLILRPAGMRNSSFAQPLPDSLAGQAASGHDGDGRPVAGRYRVHHEQAAAGLWTTPSDLARFMLSIGRSYRGEHGGLLAPTTAREMLAKAPNASGHGFGISGDGPTLRYRHSGGNLGFRGFAVAFAESGRGAVVLLNSDNGSALYPEILDAISRAHGWPRMTMAAP